MNSGLTIYPVVCDIFRVTNSKKIWQVKINVRTFEVAFDQA